VSQWPFRLVQPVQIGGAAVNADHTQMGSRATSLSDRGDVCAVTGADGFIGSHLVEALVARGARVRAMAQYNSFGNFGWLDTLPDETLASVDIIPGDVRDRGSVLGLLEGAATAYHLAALVAIPYSYIAPQSYVDTNVTGTLNVLEAARIIGTTRVVNISTSEVYGSAQHVPMAEDHRLLAQSPYAATKIAADQIAGSYYRSFDLPVVTLRLFNTYGPRQSVRAIVPTVITQLANGQALVSLGSQAPTRDFVYVNDTVTAILSAGTAAPDLVLGEVFNVGTGVETSIGDLAAQIAYAMGRPINVQQVSSRTRPSPSEVERLVCDPTKFFRHTGWRPIYVLSEGLRKTIEWFLTPGNLARYVADRAL
jgi:NDP-hexose 4,6-dehydratase